MLDQWLIEGKFTEDEAVALSCDMLAVGIDTVCVVLLFLIFEIILCGPFNLYVCLHEVKVALETRPHLPWPCGGVVIGYNILSVYVCVCFVCQLLLLWALCILYGPN